MKTLYPTIQKISALLLAVILTGAVHAQKGDYASNTKSKSQYTDDRKVAPAQVVRIVARADRKVTLSWAPFKGAVSHYVLERSVDSRHYEEAGVFFTGEWSEEPEYIYTDKFRSAYAGPLFYRLKVVGLEGTEIYTAASMAEGQ